MSEVMDVCMGKHIWYRPGLAEVPYLRQVQALGAESETNHTGR